MTVYIVSRGYPTEKYKNLGIFEMDQAKALADNGCKVIFLSVDLRSFRRKRRLGYYGMEYKGIPLYNISVPIGAVPSFFLDRVGELAFKFLYKKVLKKEGKPDIIHAHFLSMALYAGKICKKEKIPLVITEHGSQMNTSHLAQKEQKRALKAYEAADERIAVSESLSKNLKLSTGFDFKVINNIVDLDVFHYVKQDERKNFFTFISVGNLTVGKGFDILLKAFAGLRAYGKDCRLLIIGEGIEHTSLSDMAEKLGLSDSVIFTGLLDRNQICERMHDADAFVLLSKSETFGVSYIEAMAAGLPVVATKCGGPEEFVNEHNGILIDVDDVRGAENAMADMMRNIDKYDNELIRTEVIEKFSPSTIAKKIIGIYKDVLEQKKTEGIIS